MKFNSKKITVLLLSFLTAGLVACNGSNVSSKGETSSVPASTSSIVEPASSTVTTVTTGEQKLIHETKFDSSYIALTNEELQAYGFTFGDSCTVNFSNGKSIDDIPYYDGYYTRSDFPLVCGYQGYPYVQITINNCSDFWEQYELSEDLTVSITLKEKAKFIDEQTAFSMHYENDREKFPSDEVFANFREITTTNIKSGILFRGASPFNDNYNRAHYVDALLEKNNVKFILDLSDSDADLESYKEKYDLSDSYALKQDKVYLSMGSNFRLDPDEEVEEVPETENLLGIGTTTSAYRASLVKGLQQMIESDGPYYIHCVEGKDRTGFVSMLLEALCGASYSEMKKDYMVTYYNYFNITDKDSKYEAVSHLRFDEFMEFLSGKTELEDLSYVQYAKDYLIESGMSEDDIDSLIDKLTK